MAHQPFSHEVQEQKKRVSRRFSIASSSVPFVGFRVTGRFGSPVLEFEVLQSVGRPGRRTVSLVLTGSSVTYSHEGNFTSILSDSLLPRTVVPR